MRFVIPPVRSCRSEELSQRVALLEVWKTFEGQHATSADVARVEAMKPIISKRRRVDQENGQMVEGNFFDNVSIPG
jgi:hypothetical protein